jgi:S-formylglutathione hydrolase FrmB
MTTAWESIAIAGHDADVLATPDAVFGVLFLHPHGDETLAHAAANPAWTDALIRQRLACCCPRASRTWWADRVYSPFDSVLSAEHYLLQEVLPWMASAWKLAPRQIAVVGISMGGQAAVRLACRHPETVRVAAGVASAVDYQSCYYDPAFFELPELYRNPEHCRQDTATLAVRPQRLGSLFIACDPADGDWFPGNERLHEKLTAVGVPHAVDFTTTRGGHTWDYFNAMAEPVIAFCADALAKEARRLL